MSPLSFPVLGCAAVMSSPALYGAFVDGTTTPETALLRFLICAALCWAGFSALTSLVGPPPRVTHTGADGLPTGESTGASSAASSSAASKDGNLAA
jgi:hypothetical protein